jgi:hypothetical protein
MARDAFLSATTYLNGTFSVRFHADQKAPFIVLALGGATVHVFDPAVLTALAEAVTEAQDLLTAALTGQDALPDCDIAART